MEELIQKIYKENDIWYEYNILPNNRVEIIVEFGDWRHDHVFIDYHMEDNGFVKTDEVLTWDDGSDCYSSIHTYIYNKQQQLK